MMPINYYRKLIIILNLKTTVFALQSRLSKAKNTMYSYYIFDFILCVVSFFLKVLSALNILNETLYQF